MAVLRVLHAAAPGSHAATVQAVGGGGGGADQPQRPGRDAAPSGFAAHDESAPARNKRWSTTFGGNTSSKNVSGEQRRLRVYAVS